MDECYCINDENCHICAKINRYCLLCNESYKLYLDPFIVIINAETFIDITDLLCLNCVHSFTNCMQCNRNLYEPWDTVYFDINTKKYSCMCCFNDVRNKNYKKCLISYCDYCKIKWSLKTFVPPPFNTDIDYDSLPTIKITSLPKKKTDPPKKTQDPLKKKPGQPKKTTPLIFEEEEN